jgi:protease IV
MSRAWLIEERFAALLYSQLMSGRLSLSQASKATQKKLEGRYQGMVSQQIGSYVPVRKVKSRSGGNVAVMPVIGTLTKRGDLCSYGMRDYQNEMAILQEDDDIAAIVMDMEGPGGTVDGTNEFGLAVRNSIKPIVTFGDHMIASANYWVASQSDWIIGNKNNPTEFGSIGVLCVHEYWGKFIEENIGEIKIIRAPQSTDKARINPIEELSPELEKEVVEDLKGMAKDFFSAVKKGRGDRLTADEKVWGTGKMFKLPESQELGLIDGAGNILDAINKAAELANTRTTAKSGKSKSSKSSQANMNKLTKSVSSLFKGKKEATAKKAEAVEPAAAEPQGVAWAAELVFNIDGSGDGSVCNHPDSEGNARNFETKTDNNSGNEPPTDPATTEDDNWILIADESEEKEESENETPAAKATAQITNLTAKVQKLEAESKKSTTVIASLKRQLSEANAKLDKTPAAGATEISAKNDKGHEYGKQQAVNSWEKKAAAKVGSKIEE